MFRMFALFLWYVAEIWNSICFVFFCCCWCCCCCWHIQLILTKPLAVRNHTNDLFGKYSMIFLKLLLRPFCYWIWSVCNGYVRVIWTCAEQAQCVDCRTSLFRGAASMASIAIDSSRFGICWMPCILLLPLICVGVCVCILVTSITIQIKSSYIRNIAKAWRQFLVNKTQFNSLNTYDNVCFLCGLKLSSLAHTLNCYWPLQFFADAISLMVFYCCCSVLGHFFLLTTSISIPSPNAFVLRYPIGFNSKSTRYNFISMVARLAFDFLFWLLAFVEINVIWASCVHFTHPYYTIYTQLSASSAFSCCLSISRYHSMITSIGCQCVLICNGASEGAECEKRERVTFSFSIASIRCDMEKNIYDG